MLMEGIKILNQTEIIVKDNGLLVGALVLLLITLILGLAGFITGHYLVNSFKYERISMMLAALAALTSLSAAVTGITFLFSKQHTGKYKYEVTIDKSVPMTEFYEKYEIVEQRGEIFVIKEKE